jgi:hypothetical protein
MKGKTKKIVLAVAVIGAIAAGGAAFTAANTVPTHAVGFGSAVVTGAVASHIDHTLSADGMHVDKTVMTLTGNLADAPVVTAGFGPDGTALSACTATAATGVFGAANRTTVATCDYTVAPATPYLASTALQFNVAVTGVTP